jgi:hypothetical protein
MNGKELNGFIEVKREERKEEGEGENIYQVLNPASNIISTLHHLSTQTQVIYHEKVT